MVYEPNHLYRNRKYFLRQGNNLVGSGKGVQVRIEDKALGSVVANIRISNNLLTLARLSEESPVEVPSNLSAKAKCFLELGVEYVLAPEKEFKLGQWRGLFQLLEGDHYKHLKNIVNADMYTARLEPDTEKEESDDELKTLIIPDGSAEGPTQIIDFQADAKPPAREPALPEDLQPTLLIPDNASEHSAQTENLSQEENRPLHNEAGASMPATLEENDEIPEAARPATEDPQKTQGSAAWHPTIPPTAPVPPAEVRKTQSAIVQKRQLDELLEMFEDEPSVPPHVQPASMEVEDKRMVRRVLVQPQLESLASDRAHDKKSMTGSQASEPGHKRISFSGFQPTEMQKLIASKMKLAIVGPDDDYDILVVGNDLRITPRVLRALLAGKEIKTETYINNGSGRILSKVFGHIWEDIVKRPRSNVLEGDLLYIPDRLEDYRELITQAGGSYTATANKSMSKRVVKVVLSERDRDIFESYKGFKKWKFFTEKALQQSIVLGEPLEKDGIDDKYFV